MKKSDVVKALGCYYKVAVDKFGVEKAAEAYRSNQRSYPSLDLDTIFDILRQPSSERFSTASLERALRLQFSVVYAKLQAEKKQSENLGKSCPGYVKQCMKMIEELTGLSPVDESPAAGARTLTL
jgi:hypothetical protein